MKPIQFVDVTYQTVNIAPEIEKLRAAGKHVRTCEFCDMNGKPHAGTCLRNENPPLDRRMPTCNSNNAPYYTFVLDKAELQTKLVAAMLED